MILKYGKTFGETKTCYLDYCARIDSAGRGFKLSARPGLAGMSDSDGHSGRALSWRPLPGPGTVTVAARPGRSPGLSLGPAVTVLSGLPARGSRSEHRDRRRALRRRVTAESDSDE
jgi:hypothetical protein